MANTVRRGLVAVAAVAGMMAQGCGGTDASGGGFPTDPVDRELALLALGNQMDGDPRDGRTFPSPTDPLAQLGMRLFFSKALGADRDSACVTCHHPLLGGGDNLSLPVGVGATDVDLLGPGRTHSAAATGFDGGPTVPRNAPTTFNIGLWKKVLFFDGRVETLMTPTGGTPVIRTPDSAFGTQDPLAGDDLVMAQARFPVTSPEEMKGHASGALSNQQTRDLLASRVGGYGGGVGFLANAGYWLGHFRTAYNNPSGTAVQLITERNVARALAAYQASQVLVESPWKRYLGGEVSAITAQAKRGALLFMRPRDQGGKGCLECHKGDFFTDETFVALAVPQLGRGKGDGLSTREDFGRGRVSGMPQDQYAFRVPTLLNVAVTGPWGHSGAYTSLANVVRHYRNPLIAAASYDATQLTQAGIQNLATVQADTQGAVTKIAADRVASRRAVQDTPISDAEVGDLVAFLEALTDPCTKDPQCMARWIPDAVVGADPNGDQLIAKFTP